MTETQESTFHMAGSEGTGEYKVLAVSSYGRVGYRDLGIGVRIRVEPAPAHVEDIAKVLAAESGWKQPGEDDQDRFSIALLKGSEAKTALGQAVTIIERGDALAYNPQVIDWNADLS